MDKYIGRIWISVAILVVVCVIWWNGDSLKPLATQSDGSPFLIALSQLGILYIVALFVERALEVLLKAWRQGERIRLQAELAKRTGDSRVEDERKLQEYKAGTQRRALLTGLTLGILIAVSGIRLLGAIFPFHHSEEWTFQMAMFQFTDIVITAGLIAGGSATIHELMSLIDDFLRRSRKVVKKADS